MTNFLRELPAAAPSYMRGPNLEALFGAIGAQLDANAEQVLVGRLQGIPYAGGTDLARTGAARLADGRLIECEPFVLPLLAAQRGITLYATEGILSQRIRVSTSWQLHRTRGTHWGEIAHVRPYFADFVAAGGAYPTFRIVFQSNEATPAAYWLSVDPAGNRTIARASPSNWVWDGQTTKRSRWWVIVYLPPGFLAWASTLTGGVWDGSSIWDSAVIWDGIPAAILADLFSMFNDWKSAHSMLCGLIVTQLQPTDSIPGGSVHPFDPASSSTTNADGSTNLPGGNWGSGVGTVGGLIGLPTRPSWATFYGINNG